MILSLRAVTPVCIGPRRFEVGEEYMSATVPDDSVAAHLRATICWDAFRWQEVAASEPVGKKAK